MNTWPALLAALLLGSCGGSSRAPEEPEGVERTGAEHVGQGRLAPEWDALQWPGLPMRLADLRGKVVMVRFWTDTCPYCRATAPALVELDRRYRDQGLVVVGIHHPKPRGSAASLEHVSEVARAWGWQFPIALDRDWRTLDAYWLDPELAAPGDEPRATSASFVIDKQGRIRHVHPGPEFHPDGPADHTTCRRDFAAMVAVIEGLLAEPQHA